MLEHYYLFHFGQALKGSEMQLLEPFMKLVVSVDFVVGIVYVCNINIPLERLNW